MEHWRTLTGMKNELILITNQYPFGSGEVTFIEPELFNLKDIFENLVILSKSADSSLNARVDNIKIYRCSSKIEIYEVIQYAFSILFSKIFFLELRTAIKKKSHLGKAVKLIFASLINEKKLQRVLKKIVRNSNADHILIYSYWFNYSVLAAINTKHRSNKDIKVVTRVHGYDLYDERNVLGYQPFQDSTIPNIDRIIFTCESARKYYIQRHREAFNGQFFCGYMGVPKAKNKNNKQISEKQTDFILVSCSNVIPLKRIHIIIEALALLQSCKIRWYHFGDGASMQSIRNLAETKLGLRKNIKYKFCGQTDNNKLLQFYASGRVNCFITTSETEGMPVSVMEALAYGIPIIATDVGGVHEQVHENENGILLKANPSNQEVATAIKCIYDLSQAEKTKFGENSYRIWKNLFDIDKNMTILKAELNKVIMEK